MRHLTILLLAVAAGLAVADIAGAAGYRPPHRADGVPDLEGIWGDQLMITPLERPSEFKSVVISDREATKYENDIDDYDAYEKERRKTRPTVPSVGDAEHLWLGGQKLRMARIDGRARSSILIDPADGQLPLRPEAVTRLKARRLEGARNFDDPERRPNDERCLLSPGPPITDAGEIRIVQAPGFVAIDFEVGQGARIVRLGDRRHGPPSVTRWMGDSVGWFEGDTLVVETTGFDPHANAIRPPLSPTAKVTERFSRAGPNELLYRFTVEDPVNYTHPWSGVLPLGAVSGRMLSYECHEGNYALANILAGARRVERDGGTPEPLDGGDPPAKPSGTVPAP